MKIIWFVLISLFIFYVAKKFENHKEDLIGIGHSLVGIKAKRLCYGVFLQNREIKDIVDNEINLYTWVPGPDPVVDYKTETVTFTIGYGSYSISSTAQKRGDLGCTFISDKDGLPKRTFTKPKTNYDPNEAWPKGSKFDITKNREKSKANETLLNTATNFAMGNGARGFLVLHKGEIISESYSHGYTKDTLQLGWSMTKSVLNALFGVRIKQNKISLQDKVRAPEWTNKSETDKITVDSMLRMSSGIVFWEHYDIGGDPLPMLFGLNSSNAASFAASKTKSSSFLEHEHDTVWSYSSGTSNILSRFLRSTFDTVEDYWNFAHNFFSSISISSAIMEVDGEGNFVASSFMYATARDWAKFGLLFSQNGKFGENLLFDENWVSYSTTPKHSNLYGAAFWLNANNSKFKNPKVPSNIYWAHGFEHQYVLIDPTNEIVIVRLGLTTDISTHDKEMGK